jgi:hypothetical protein
MNQPTLAARLAIEAMRKRQLMSKSRVNKLKKAPLTIAPQSASTGQAVPDVHATPDIQAAPDPQSTRRYTAICGLIDGKSLEDIATECEISTRTLRRWMEHPQFIKEFEKAHEQFLERVTAKLQAAADRAAEKVIKLMDCGIPTIEMHAAKTILRATTKAAEIAELKKLIQELQQAAARQSKQIARLQSDSDELHTLKTDIKKGTLTRPKWVTPDDWSKFIHNNEEDNRVIVSYVNNHPSALSFPDDDAPY